MTFQIFRQFSAVLHKPALFFLGLFPMVQYFSCTFLMVAYCIFRNILQLFDMDFLYLLCCFSCFFHSAYVQQLSEADKKCSLCLKSIYQIYSMSTVYAIWLRGMSTQYVYMLLYVNTVYKVPKMLPTQTIENNQFYQIRAAHRNNKIIICITNLLLLLLFC